MNPTTYQLPISNTLAPSSALSTAAQGMSLPTPTPPPAPQSVAPTVSPSVSANGGMTLEQATQAGYKPTTPSGGMTLEQATAAGYKPTQPKPFSPLDIPGKIADVNDQIVQGVQNAWYNLPFIKQRIQDVKNVGQGAGELMGGAVAAVGQPIANALRGRPLTEHWGSAIKQNAEQTGQFGASLGENLGKGASMLPLIAGGGTIPLYMLGAAGLHGGTQQFMKGVGEATQEIKKGIPWYQGQGFKDVTTGTLNTGLGILGILGARSPRGVDAQGNPLPRGMIIAKPIFGKTGMIPTSFQGSYNPENQQLAQDLNMKSELPVSLRTNSKFVQGGEAIAERGLFGQQIVDRAQTFNDELQSLPDQIVAKLNPDTSGALSVRDLGAVAKNGFQQLTDTFQKAQDPIMENIVQQYGSQPAEASHTIATLNQYLSESQQSLLPSSAQSLYETLQSNLLQNPKDLEAEGAPPGQNTEVTFNNLWNTSKIIGAKLKSANDPIVSANYGALKDLYGSLREDLVATAERVAPDSGGTQLRESFSNYKSGVQLINSATGKYLQDASPEDIFQHFIRPNNPTDIAKLHEAIGDDAFNQVSGTWLNQLITSSRGPDGSVNAKTLLQNLGQWDPETVKEILTPEQGQKLAEVTQGLQKQQELSGNFSQAMKMGTGSPTAYATRIGILGGQAFAAVGALASGNWPAALEFILGPIASEYVGNKLFTTAIGQKFLTTGFSAPLQTTPTATPLPMAPRPNDNSSASPSPESQLPPTPGGQDFPRGFEQIPGSAEGGRTAMKYVAENSLPPAPPAVTESVATEMKQDLSMQLKELGYPEIADKVVDVDPKAMRDFSDIEAYAKGLTSEPYPLQTVLRWLNNARMQYAYKSVLQNGGTQDQAEQAVEDIGPLIRTEAAKINDSLKNPRQENIQAMERPK